MILVNLCYYLFVKTKLQVCSRREAKLQKIRILFNFLDVIHALIVLSAAASKSKRFSPSELLFNYSHSEDRFRHRMFKVRFKFIANCCRRFDNKGTKHELRLETELISISVKKFRENCIKNFKSSSSVTTGEQLVISNDQNY